VSTRTANHLTLAVDELVLLLLVISCQSVVGGG